MDNPSRPQPGKAPAFAPERHLHPLWRGLVQNQTLAAGFYDDGLAWSYGEERAWAALSGKPPRPEFVTAALARIYSQRLATEAFYSRTGYRQGYTLGPNTLKFEHGRIANLHEPGTIMFTRGIQYAWIAAALLPAFEQARPTWSRTLEELDLTTLRNGLAPYDVPFEVAPEAVADALTNTVDGTIAYWAGVRNKLGYLPQGHFTDGRSSSWTRMAELGAYAHLIKLAAYRVLLHDGVSEWERIAGQKPDAPLPHHPLPDSVLRAQGQR
jgi:hypothetical protein